MLLKIHVLRIYVTVEFLGETIARSLKHAKLEIYSSKFASVAKKNSQ